MDLHHAGSGTGTGWVTLRLRRLRWLAEELVRNEVLCRPKAILSQATAEIAGCERLGACLAQVTWCISKLCGGLAYVGSVDASEDFTVLQCSEITTQVHLALNVDGEVGIGGLQDKPIFVYNSAAVAMEEFVGLAC